ncbi:MAG: isoleucine--tRNA ligase [Firmicutes bacterium]|nr:isoleucine--tRNA ligase [Bacillota bacterium]
MYKKVNPNLDFVQREKEVVSFWKERDIFLQSLEKNKGQKEFSFYDGPPTANGKPHIGHVLTRVMKDIIPRYKTMKGHHVKRIAGWDTHGLPVELEVEKSLGLQNKADIEKYGVDKFIEKCKESVFKYQKEWEEMTSRVGYWVDMDNPYVTYHDNYIESIWWSLQKIFNEGLIYKGHKVVPFCPRCGTAVSSHEVAQGYKDVDDETVIAKFKLINETNTYFLAWTTTPWTLPSNVALCVNPKHNYVKVKSGDEFYILAKECVPKILALLDDDYEIVDTFKGKKLEKIQYEPLFDFAKNVGAADCQPNESNYAYYVVCDDFVTLTDGTGIVHIAPTYGEDDARIGKKHNLPFVQMVNEFGIFIDCAGEFKGQSCKKADKQIIKNLQDRKLEFSSGRARHSYPHCWRCDSPLLYFARSSWFIKVTALKEQLIKNNKQINWMPENIKEGRMGNFLENVIDWGISRERYWGTPLPIWICDACEKMTVVGSKAELRKLGNLKKDIELHKPHVDTVSWKCSCKKGTLRRTPEVIDCWYDSGAMPFAQYHYPFENSVEFHDTFPADFISEAVDQTRGWFYTLLAISTLLFGKPPFKNCIVLGHVLDKNGKKMSKHIGNVVDPWSVLDTEGADALRWYFYTNSAPYLPSRFYGDAVRESKAKFLGTLYNTYYFYILYADIDKFDPTKHKLKDLPLTLMDRWILSELNLLIDFVDKSLNKYQIFESARELIKFVDKLSNWFVRRSRERFWGSVDSPDKAAAFRVLYECLEVVTRLAAPFVPFISEDIYQNLVRVPNKKAPISVHLADFPKVNKSLIDKELASKMEEVLRCVEAGRSARNFSNLKMRQPLKKVMLHGVNASEYVDIIKDELNVKVVEFITNLEGFVQYDVKPQLKTLGPKYGKLLNGIREYLMKNGEYVVNKTNNNGEAAFEINGEKVVLTAEDLLVEIKSAEGFSVGLVNGVSAILDTALSPELIAECHMRELISKIQNLRKEEDFHVSDFIKINIECCDELKKVFQIHGERIKKETLTKEIIFECENGKEIDINGLKVTIKVEKRN